MPIKAKYNGSYKDITDLMNVDESIDYVLAKTSSSYKRVYTATRSIEGIPPTTFKSIKPGANLTDYRIYGQTVDGESVGDRTANLFDKNYFIQNNLFGMDSGLIVADPYTISTIIPCNPNTKYTISKIVTNRFIIWGCTDYPTQGEYCNGRIATDYDSSSLTFTTGNDDNYLLIMLFYQRQPTDPTIEDVKGSLMFTYGYKVPVTVEGKNLLPNADWAKGYISLDGRIVEPSSSMQEITSPFVKVIPGKTYVFSYYPNEGEPWRAVCYYAEDKRFIKRQSAASLASPVAFTVESGVGYVRFSYRSYGDGTFSQLELGDIVTDYEPYHAPVTSNLYLPEQIRKVGDEAEYIDYATQKQHRVRKNLLQNNARSQTFAGVTFTVNNDGSVTCNTYENGATDVAYLVICETPNIPESTNLILSGCPEGGSTLTYALQYSNWVNHACDDTGSGINFKKYDYETYPATKVVIRICKGCVCNNLTFYPMIRKADIEDDTYEPYIEDTDVDVTLPALPTLVGTNVLSVGTEVQPSKIDITGHIKTISGGS